MAGIYGEVPAVDATLTATGDKDVPVSLDISEHPPPPPPPFQIEPLSAPIPAYGSTVFRVMFEPPDNCDRFRAVLVADGSWALGESRQSLGPSSSKSSSSSSSSSSAVDGSRSSGGLRMRPAAACLKMQEQGLICPSVLV